MHFNLGDLIVRPTLVLSHNVNSLGKLAKKKCLKIWIAWSPSFTKVTRNENGTHHLMVKDACSGDDLRFHLPSISSKKYHSPENYLLSATYSNEGASLEWAKPDIPFALYRYTAISIKVVHEQSGKVEYERERLLGIANKLMNFQSGFV
jgi:hypothetical protein